MKVDLICREIAGIYKEIAGIYKGGISLPADSYYVLNTIRYYILYLRSPYERE